jgi:transcriptional regulator with XRE-family HTH domain
MESLNTLGKRCRHARQYFGLKRKDVAKAAGMSYSTLADIENGNSHTSTKIASLSGALGVRAAWLENEDGPMVSTTNASPPDARACEPIPRPYMHEHETVRQIIALLETTDDVGKGIAYLAISQALEKYRPAQPNIA